MRTQRAPVIGVLTPFIGGFYYGAAMAGIERVAQLRGATIVALQTTELELARADVAEDQYLGLDVVDGWLAVNEFDAPAFTARIRARGVPLAYVNSRPECEGGTCILPDNHSSMRAAVEHLIEHGHRRIAFAGSLGQVDLRERYEAYLSALRGAGIEVDPSLLFESASNVELEGEELGARIVRAGLPCTAIVAGTDRLALGILLALRSAGVSVPRDLALIGFDDIERSQLTDPPLTTVRQDFARVTATATATLLDHILNGVPLPSVVRVPTVFVRRQSCGCRADYCSSVPTPSGGAEDAEEALALAMRAVATHDRLDEGSETWPGALAIARLLGQVGRGGAAPDDQDLDALWSGFLEGRRDAASIDQVLTVLEGHVRTWPVAAEAGRALAVLLRQLRVALIRNWRRLEIERNRFYESVAEANAKVNHALATWRPENGMDLSWLRWTRASYACLALWSEPVDEGPRSLQVVGEYTADESTEPLRGSSYLPTLFPPRSIGELIRRLGKPHVFSMVTVKSGSRERGVLAIAAPIEVELLDRVGSAGDWAVQVGAALERAEIDQQLRKNAFEDALTGLPNRAQLMQRLESITRDEGSAIAVLFLDLDDFKKINDSKGHSAGDQLLVAIAGRLERAVGEAGFVARLGGDEFSVVTRCVGGSRDALAQASSLQTALSAPFMIDGEIVFISCSIGVAVASEESASPAALLRDADTAMYRAKLQGPGRCEVFRGGMHAQAVERLRLDSRLRQALEREEFALVYQPVVSLASGRPLGVEALLRWCHPEHGVLGPGRFMSVAEDVGLSIPIDKWVLATACRAAKNWQHGGTPPLRVSVNISVEHLLSAGFVEFVESTLVESGLEPEMLGLELVERSLASERDLTVRVLGRLLDLGVSVAIDDFGTGYSSLSYLKDFPVRVLKIDRSFVVGLPNDSRDGAVVNAIITMARGLGLSVVAEGVETEQQLEALVKHGCDAVQGYLLSRPLELEACCAFLASTQTRLARTTVAEREPALRRIK